MRYAACLVVPLFFVSPVAAQDLWNGAYAGVSVGFGAGPVTVTNSGSGVPPGPYNYTIDAPLAGFELGYNMQLGGFVLGVEADLGYAAPLGEGYVPSSNPAYHQDLTIGAGPLATAGVRAGYAFERTLIYGKTSLAYFGGQALQKTTKPGYDATPSQAFTGTAVGAGFEQMLTDTISFKAEYQHYMFGKVQGYQTSTVVDPPTPAGTVFPNETELGFDSVKVGLNFHF